MCVPGGSLFVFIIISACSVLDAHAGLLINGSFENGVPLVGGPDPGRYLPLDPGSTGIDGWIVTRGQIDYVGTYFSAADGARSLDLDGSPGFGGIEQTFDTVPGQRYRVTFALAGNPNAPVDLYPPTVKELRVTAAGQSSDFSFDVTGHDPSNMGWSTQTWDFTALASTTTLEFYSLDNLFGGNGQAGPALDNVSVDVTPEPSSLSLIGLGCACLLARQRRGGQGLRKKYMLRHRPDGGQSLIFRGRRFLRCNTSRLRPSIPPMLGSGTMIGAVESTRSGSLLAAVAVSPRTPLLPLPVLSRINWLSKDSSK